MEEMEKEYYFYRNTPEYKEIINKRDWSIVFILYLSSIRIYLGDNYDFYINIAIAISLGYIVSYFYFNNITYKENVLYENNAFDMMKAYGIFIYNIYEKISIGYDVEDKFYKDVHFVYKTFRKNIRLFSKSLTCQVYFNESIDILDKILSDKEFNASIKDIEKIILNYKEWIFSFEDNKELQRALSDLNGTPMRYRLAHRRMINDIKRYAGNDTPLDT